ncbi:high-potential iron-sulfur protein [Salisaeta longa]|uniref:high-potential iron-sulfur protein n=1 Tax=Salisaeta longa TaxID=503170 RepID=UPI0003B4BE94|nr:high-potential iron-sulfur protein [Salisaeta longa]
MDEQQKTDVSRRAFLQRMGLLSVAGAGAGVLLSACGGGSKDKAAAGGGAGGGQAAGGGQTKTAAASCDDLSGLSASEKKMRSQMVKSLQYVENSPNPNKNCANCQLYQQAEAGKNCGGCQLFPGPVNPQGYCTSWVAAS